MKYQITFKVRMAEDFHSAIGSLMFVNGCYLEKISCNCVEKKEKNSFMIDRYYSCSVLVRLGSFWNNKPFLRSGAYCSLSRRVDDIKVKEV